VATSTHLVREAKGALKSRLPSALWRLAKRHLGQRTRAIRLDEIDAVLAEVEPRGLAGIRSFHLELDDVQLPADPYSPQYRDAQLALFARISGRAAYSTDLEHTPLDVASATHEPYPYFTRSTAQVGDQLIAIGHLIKSLGIDPPAHVLEFGPGWGNTTVALAQTGFDVTAVDVNPQFLELISKRLGPLSSRVTCVRADMLGFRPSQPVDAIVFFESFHHCSDPLALISALPSMLKPGGRVLFASEPIDDFAMPWGVRLDGESIWAMRKNGWLELGFETSFFLTALERAGFHVSRERSHALTALTDVIIARR
jgi:2-polyprenyl-3-methyl-5-hydroxy-6-metoxy-1,4-benzoquinol methylase